MLRLNSYADITEIVRPGCWKLAVWWGWRGARWFEYVGSKHVVKGFLYVRALWFNVQWEDWTAGPEPDDTWLGLDDREEDEL